MKKTLLIVAMMAFASASFAGGVDQQQQQQTSVVSGSESAASNAGNTQTIVFEAAQPVDTTSRDLLDDKNAALDRATALELARVNGETARAVANSAIRNTPSMNGPALVSSNDTCMGSASGAVSAPGFGLSLGKTYNDTNCVMLKNSRELWNMGMKAAALALMCNDSANKEALELTGFVCPQTEKANKQAAAAQAPAPVVAKTSTPAATTVASSGYTGNDPIIKARLGLK